MVVQPDDEPLQWQIPTDRNEEWRSEQRFMDDVERLFCFQYDKPPPLAFLRGLLRSEGPPRTMASKYEALVWKKLILQAGV